jgi:hypothetical protein
MRWEKGLAIEVKLLSRHRTNWHLLIWHQPRRDLNLGSLISTHASSFYLAYYFA